MGRRDQPAAGRSNRRAGAPARRGAAAAAVARFDAVRRWLVAAAVALAAFGVAVSVGVTGPLLEPWHRGLAARWAPHGLGTDAIAVRDFLLGSLGATSAAFWILLAWLFHEPFRRREAWAVRAAWSGLGVWLALGATSSVWQRAWFDVLAFDLPAILLVAVPLWLARGGRSS